MAESQGVTRAINAALEDINLLRPLVYAQTADAANAILTAYSPNLTLSGGEVPEFFALLQRGHVTITARELVGYYDSLQPPKLLRAMLPLWKEWVL